MAKKRFPRILSAWFLILVLILGGCGRFSSYFSDKRQNSSQKDNSNQNVTENGDADAAFEAFTEELFTDEVQANTLNLHYTLVNPSAYGIENAPVTLGDRTKENRDASADAAKDCLDVLEEFDAERLSLKNQLTYDVLTEYFSTELDGAGYYLYEEPLGPLLGVQAQLPLLFAEYSFRSRDDVDTYLSLLKQVKDYYAQILDFEKAKSAAGLFMADYAADDIIAQCREFTSSPDDNYLLSTFSDRIGDMGGLSEREKSDYIAENKRIFTETVLPAYEMLIDGLTALKGTGGNERGLCYLPQGEAYYEYLVKANTGTDRTVKQVKKRLDKQMDGDMEAMADLLSENPDLIDEIDEDSFSMEEPEEMLADLQEKIEEDFPAAPETSCEIKYVPESLEGHASPAFYLVSPIDDSSEQVIYINRGNDYDGIELYTTLAHEGYPGHLYQTICTNASGSCNIRSLLNFSGYTEGWATYVEMYSYGIAGLDGDLAELLQVNNSIVLNIYSHLDVGVHYDGWSFKEACEYLRKFGIDDVDTSRDIYKAIVEEPTNYLKYYLGYLEFLDLRDEAEASLGDRFLLKNFHAFILQTGPAPFAILKKYMKLIL